MSHVKCPKKLFPCAFTRVNTNFHAHINVFKHKYVFKYLSPIKYSIYI